MGWKQLFGIFYLLFALRFKVWMMFVYFDRYEAHEWTCCLLKQTKQTKSAFTSWETETERGKLASLLPLSLDFHSNSNVNATQMFYTVDYSLYQCY